ncbi:MAG: hypothetical protein ACI8RZ_003203 [Myxococcota bacterium]|jgi:hypothetical protein
MTGADKLLMEPLPGVVDDLARPLESCVSSTMMDLMGKDMEVESGTSRSDTLQDPLTEEPWLDEAALKSGTFPQS